MYNVLLVDDERIILDGIAQIVKWNELDTTLVGTARNGVAAYAHIMSDPPDLVISDIRMPGMDGLELVAKTRKSHPDVRFILLSGFSDFEYAKQAMSHGVQHYLLKPCNEQAISQAIVEVVQELRAAHKREQFLAQMKGELQKTLTYAKAQFLKEWVTNRTYGMREWEDYRRIFGLAHDDQPVRLLLMEVEGDAEYEHLFALSNIAEDLIGEDTLLGTTIGKQVLLLIKEERSQEQLFADVERIRVIFREYYRLDVTMAASDPGEITRARQMFRQTQECLQHRFYLGEGGLITGRDIVGPSERGEMTEMLLDAERICLLIRTGRWEEVADELNRCFDEAVSQRMEAAAVRSEWIPLYITIMRMKPESEGDQATVRHLAAFEQLASLQAMRQHMLETIHPIVQYYEAKNRSRNSVTVASMLEIAKAHIGNPQLSLQWVAGEMLYMNADYLGKLFKKETGQSFSQYVARMRMDEAVEQLTGNDDVKVFELAEKLGFGDNPQYFSQVFKRHTGFTPSTFKRSP